MCSTWGVRNRSRAMHHCRTVHLARISRISSETKATWTCCCCCWWLERRVLLADQPPTAAHWWRQQNSAASRPCVRNRTNITLASAIRCQYFRAVQLLVHFNWSAHLSSPVSSRGEVALLTTAFGVYGETDAEVTFCEFCATIKAADGRKRLLGLILW